ncbi:MAG: hypothetical protein IKU64_00255, partial [Bacteroides sp.]|nr:hypothetical protein [Bacteroides sp.]
MMKRMKLIRNIGLLLGMLLWVACQNNDAFEAENSASLTLTISMPEDGMNTRAAGELDSDLNGDGTVSADELCIDGKRMYSLGIYLLYNNVIIAYKEIKVGATEFSNDNTTATLSFNNLEYHKTYTLYAVANYGNNGSLRGKVSSISTAFGYAQIYTSESPSYLCNYQTPYPLSLKQSITLQPGTNKISGVLSRTYARLRISVRNHSALKDLKVTNLSFPTNFAQNQFNLFEEGKMTAGNQPDPTSTHAIVPFKANTKIPKIDASNNVTKKTIFDAYLLESYGGSYNYTLGLEYGDDATYNRNNEPIRDQNFVSSAVRNSSGKGALFLIYHPKTKTYLCTKSNSTNVEADTEYGTDNAVNSNYVWNFKNAAGENDMLYYIQSMGDEGYYIQGSVMNKTVGKVPLTANKGSDDYFNVGTRNQALGIKSKQEAYIGVEESTNEVYRAAHDGKDNDNGVQEPTTPQRFWFYNVTLNSQNQNNTPKTHTETIPIRIT